jgi:hypothetical protein
MHISGSAGVAPAVSKCGQHNKISSRCKPKLYASVPNYGLNSDLGAPFLARFLREKWGFLTCACRSDTLVRGL